MLSCDTSTPAKYYVAEPETTWRSGAVERGGTAFRERLQIRYATLRKVPLNGAESRICGAEPRRPSPPRSAATAEVLRGNAVSRPA